MNCLLRFAIPLIVLPSTVHAASLPFTPSDITQLSQDTYWLKLGHYLNPWFSDHTSTVDSASFFFAEDGQFNPESELNATIRALYSGSEAEKQVQRCRFPARYTWLEEKLGEHNPILDCPELHRWEKELQPERLTLVFPTAFMNSPSSMFGHTLLRIDAKGQTKDSELISYAVNFAASPDANDNAALYALKGLIGSYPSQFTVMPYYVKVREYNDIESRDIWEYPLTLSKAEVRRIMLHLWEMNQAEFDYYFLDENCAYHQLALLQLANQDLDLVSDFKVYAIPSDTVKLLVDNELTSPVHYRESFGTRLNHQSQIINDRIYLAAKALKDDNMYPSSDAFSDNELVQIYEFAYEWLNFELYDLGLNRRHTAKTLTNILIKRSQLEEGSPFPAVNVPKHSPDQGHDSTRIGLTRNHYQTRDDAYSLEWRPAYHDLYDRQGGYIPGAKINFLNTNISVDDNQNVRLEQLLLLDFMSLAPSNRVFDSMGWSIKAGLNRPDTNGDSRTFINGGAGKAWAFANNHHLYGLLQGEVNHGSLTDHNIDIGAGPRIGFLSDINFNNRVGLEADWIGLYNSTVDYHTSISGTWNHSFSKDTALRTQLGYAKWHGEQIIAKASFYYYF
ncbi:DUF4105 domain-containing protein [Vibrio sp.]|nr:DUF4105 domain-containing protein [Vibrio sp.]